MNHRHVVNRQQRRIGQEDGLAADLDRELRGRDDGRADALHRLDDGDPDAGLELPHDLACQQRGDITEVCGLPTVDVLCNAA